MRSRVDLPQPDGPTSTTNSPSLDPQVDVDQDLGLAIALVERVDAQRRHVGAPHLTAPAVRPLIS